MDVLTFLVERADRRLQAGDAAGAHVLLDEAIVIAPGNDGVLRRLARLLLAGDPVRAALAAADLARLSPDDVEAHGLLGQALAAQDRAVEAAGAFAAAARLAPNDGGVQSNHALALLRIGQAEAALPKAQESVRLAPALVEAWANLGHVLQALKRGEEALAAFRQALALRPEHPDALLGIAAVQSASGAAASACATLQRACRAAPGWPQAWMDLGTALLAAGAAGEAVAAYRQARALAPAYLGAASNLLQALQYDPAMSDEAATEAAREWGAAMPVLAPPPRRAGPRLRVGYVSADLYRHPVGWLGAAAIAAHEAVDVTIYANQLERDDITERVAARAVGFRSIVGLGDAQVAEQVRADRIDVLVDLSGHTGGNRLGVFALRPAPVQASWLGYPATTGLPAIDAALFDAGHVPPEAEALFTERVIRLEGGRFAYAPRADAPPPARSGDRPPTFGSFNNLAKLNPPLIALWARVLEAVPGSRLALRWRSLADPLVKAHLAEQFAAHGIAADRLELAGLLPHDAFLATYAGIDVALDPRPFGGGLTTCEALWMGVPVVTWPGLRPASRQSHAILGTIGRPEWSVADADAYVATAAALATDPAELDRIRGGLRGQMAGSPLLDGPRLARALEGAYAALCG